MNEQNLPLESEQFYELRDRRTTEYLARTVGDIPSVHIVAGRVACSTAAGQLALLALANQVVRVHRSASFDLHWPSAPVFVRTTFPGALLADVLLATAHEIDPYSAFSIGPALAGAVSIGLGPDIGPGFNWYIGADSAIAHFALEPVPIGASDSTVVGAALASCLGAAALLRTALHLVVKPLSLSAWNYAEGQHAELGPSALPRLDIGRVLMVGAGAVGASLVYWLNAISVSGDHWTIVDGDVVKLHNTNRGLIFTPAHAGWPGRRGVNKAALLANVLGGSMHRDCWLHECGELDGRRFDVVLALANEYGVRRDLAHLGAAVAFQATTGMNWLSQLHRHILGRDGCIWCRTGEDVAEEFGCSTGSVITADGGRADAALPFLSAASGLMLATALHWLAAGEIVADPYNCWSWDFASAHRFAGRPAARRCKDSCALVLDPQVRRVLNAGTKWAELDVGEV